MILQTAKQSLTIFIDSILSVSTQSLPAGLIGQVYSVQLAAVGGVGPYTWSLDATSGSLPAGLSISSGGLISGIPTVGGTSNLVVSVTDTGV